MRTWVRDQSLSLFFLALFVVTLAGQSVAGWKSYNEQQLEHDSPTVTYARYLVSSDYGQAVTENWQSEYLQFVMFIMATIWLVQRGSNESKPISDIGRESDEKQKVGPYAKPKSPLWAKVGGWRTTLYSNSLVLVMLVIFFGSWFGQSVTGWTEYNAAQRDHDQSTVSWAGYMTRPDFWENTLQNWQSEFLAVGTMAAYTIYLRQRGSPESKPVGAPHDETGSSG
jgi:Domain of unknown function (DUF6766)